MNDEQWQNQYKGWKSLKPFQIKLLDEGAKTLSQSWLLNEMWCDWKALRRLKDIELAPLKAPLSKDPWEEA